MRFFIPINMPAPVVTTAKAAQDAKTARRAAA
jgi:hypothetical protein